MNTLKLVDLVVKISNKVILNNFNLTIRSGEIHTIMGPNGVGKSTLSRVIMGDDTYKLISGDILYNDKSIIDLSTDERAKLGLFLTFQNPLEIEGISNQDFLRNAISIKEGKHSSLYEFIKNTEDSLKQLKMDKGMIHRNLNVGFSGGEKKRNEVLQIKLLKPQTIILDELDSGLDVDSLRIVSENVYCYVKENNCGVLMITHHPRILDYIKPDYVHVMVDGKIVRSGDYKLAIEVENDGYEKYKSYAVSSKND